MSRQLLRALGAPLAAFAVALPLAAQSTTPRVTKDAPRTAARAGTGAAAAELPRKRAPQPTTAAITAADLMSRLYVYADDSLMGRQVGTPWNDRATDIIAAEARRLGLEPAGENGTFFQSAVQRRALASSSSFGVDGGAPMTMGRDYIPRDPQSELRPFDGVPVVYAGTWADAALLSGDAVAGKVVLVSTPLDAAGRPTWNNLRVPITRRFPGAAAIVVAALDGIPVQFQEQLLQGGVGVRGDATAPTSATQQPAFVWITRDAAATLLGAPLAGAAPGTAGKTVRGMVRFETAPAPGRNVVAILRGSDPVLRNKYVAIGAHNDHIGFDHEPVDHDSLRAVLTVTRPMGADSPDRPVTPEETSRIRRMIDSLHTLHGGVRVDSIYNGADDDGSGSMGLLEIAEAFATAPVKPKRSLVFVWHTGEEAGLFGAQYFTDHPTVPRDSIVAQLNMDMVGRGLETDMSNAGPAYVQLVGSKRLSTELGELVERVGADRPAPFRFDYTFDANGHPEQYYCRSDHYMYARYGIPVVFFSTGGHRDYHQVTDEPQYIAYPKYAAVTQLIHDVALQVANLDHRVVVDGPKPDPRGQCRQ